MNSNSIECLGIMVREIDELDYANADDIIFSNTVNVFVDSFNKITLWI